MLKALEIKGLFNRFDYNIKLKKDGITIITGPNGYGKSTILKIIQDFADGDIVQIISHKYTSIKLIFDKQRTFNVVLDEECIVINDKNKILRDTVLASRPSRYSEKMRRDENGKLRVIDIKNKFLKATSTAPKLPHYFEEIGRNEYVYLRTGDVINIDKMGTADKLIYLYSIDLTEKDKSFLKIIDEIKNYLGEIKFIGAQRLIAEISEKNERRTYREATMRITKVINDIPEKLTKEISRAVSQHSALSSQLDSTYPKRLFSEEIGLTEDEYAEILKEITLNQAKLKKYGLAVFESISNITFKHEFAKALKVHFSDSRKKYQMFGELVGKLELFESIVNGKLNYKKIILSKDAGLEILNKENNQSLELENLSSGEQEIIVLFYQLIFETAEKILLIDEPEISLHIAWQKELLEDFKKIVRLNNNKIEIIIATHSPQIINENWDIQIDLGELYGK